jgi:hypothetical protein
MPWTHKGKTVYKKNPDGSTGKKVGKTKGDVKKYLAALYASEGKEKGKKSFTKGVGG